MEHFRTSRLIARDWTASDALDAFAIYGRDEVMRWLGAPPRRAVASLAQMRARLDAMIQRGSDEPDFGLWALELRAGRAGTDSAVEPASRGAGPAGRAGAVVGAALLARLPGDDGEVEIGWHLNPDFWGHGYATEAGRGVVGLAFGQAQVGPTAVEIPAGRAPIDRVIALVDPDNVRSQAVCRRLGMAHLGQADQYYGVTLEVFELRRGDQAGSG